MGKPKLGGDKRRRWFSVRKHLRADFIVLEATAEGPPD